ncbi:homeobox KN domain-containing protein, partial [Chytriomyces sp. MP71]
NVTALLFKWLMEHQHEPYPNEEEKKMMSVETGLNLNQINDWFINARRRYL